jgi:hypothetical protein
MTTSKAHPMPIWKRLLFSATFGLISNRKLRSMPVWKRVLLAAAIAFITAALYRSVSAEMHRDSLALVGLTGTHHIGPNFNIAEFYVNGNYESNVGREGYGGDMCCVLLPKKWRPGLVVEVRWAVGDWSKENRAEINAQNYRSITFTCFKASVPVEKYETAERLFLHFFSGGKVRAVSSMFTVLGESHPIQRGDARAADTATVGHRVDAIFTVAEMAEMQRKHETRNTFFGVWK